MKLLKKGVRKNKAISISFSAETLDKINSLSDWHPKLNRSTFINRLVEDDYRMVLESKGEHVDLYELSKYVNNHFPNVRQGVNLMLSIMKNELKDEFTQVLRDRGIIE